MTELSPTATPAVVGPPQREGPAGTRSNNLCSAQEGNPSRRPFTAETFTVALHGGPSASRAKKSVGDGPCECLDVDPPAAARAVVDEQPRVACQDRIPLRRQRVLCQAPPKCRRQSPRKAVAKKSRPTAKAPKRRHKVHERQWRCARQTVVVTIVYSPLMYLTSRIPDRPTSSFTAQIGPGSILYCKDPARKDSAHPEGRRSRSPSPKLRQSK